MICNDSSIRDDYWDLLKFLLIFLVVYGHILAPFAPDGSTNRVIYSIIYFFHMPLFVFISGRFSQIRDHSKFIRNILSLLATFILFQIIWRIIPELYDFWGGQISLIKLFQRILCPGYTLWYLLSMVFWRFLILAIPDYLQKHQFIAIVASIIISLLSGFIPFNTELSFQRTSSYLPFFILGFYSNKIDIKKMLGKIPIIIALLWFLLFAFLICIKFNTNLDYVTYNTHSYWRSPIKPIIMNFEIRSLYLLMAALLGVMFMRLSLAIKSNMISKWGRLTLFIYIWHSFLVKIVAFLISKGFIPNNCFLLFIYSIIVFTLLLSISNIQIFNIIQNPISWIVPKNNYDNKEKN